MLEKGVPLLEEEFDLYNIILKLRQVSAHMKKDDQAHFHILNLDDEQKPNQEEVR